MKVAFITRATLHDVYGGGAVHIFETANHLKELGIDVTIHQANEKIDYNSFNLLHFFDLIRPANILYHINKTNKPFVVSPIFVDYSEYDRLYRKGVSGLVLKLFSSKTEYVKTVSRWMLGKDVLPGKEYLWKGQDKSIKKILQRAVMLLPNSKSEYNYIKQRYSIDTPYTIIPNGINEKIFKSDNSIKKDPNLILCAARIEGVKNQISLIKALNNTRFRLLLAGGFSPNQKSYYRKCKKIAADNIEFTGLISQQELVSYYSKAKVHILPSWFETCGLSSLEAAAMGCNIVISDKGFAKDYFENNAVYCEPGDPKSIFEAVVKASCREEPKEFQTKVVSDYTWRRAAIKTLEAYKKIMKE